MSILRKLGLVALVTWAAPWQPASAATLTVNSTADVPDAVCRGPRMVTATGFSLAEAAKKGKQGVDLTGMVSDTDGRYAYQADVDWSKYTAIVIRPFLVSAKKEYKGVTTVEGEEMLIRSLELQCPLQKNEPREDCP